MILACLDGDEEGREAVAAAERLAAASCLRLVVVRVLGGAGARPRGAASPLEWTLKTDSPVEPLGGFVRRNRVRHVVLGPRAAARWGDALLLVKP
jgi:hypothetical protein